MINLRAILHPTTFTLTLITLTSCSRSPEPTTPYSEVAPQAPVAPLVSSVPQGKSVEQFGGGTCQVAELVGFNKSEPWGAWGDQDPARVVFKVPVRGHVALKFNAYTMNDHESHKLKLRLGGRVRTVELEATPKVFELDYPLAGEAKELVLSGITPRTAQSVGLANDVRYATVGLIGIECTDADHPR
jgi:hypothetical protein